MNTRNRPKAVIVDMDGTLVNIAAIRYFVATPGKKDFDAFHRAARACPPNRQALDFCRRHYASGHVIVVVTARMERHYASSRAWLDEHMPVPFDGPIMRPDGVRHSDAAVKSRISRYLVRNYDIRAACDDNPSIVALWREQGIPVEVVPGWQDQAGGDSRPNTTTQEGTSLTAAIVTVEHADGTTEVWNTSQSLADSIRHHLLSDVGAPDLDTAGSGVAVAEDQP